MGRPVNTIGPTRGPTYLDNNNLCAMLRFRCFEFLLLLLLRRRARVPAKRSINTAKTELYIYSLSMVEAWWTLLGAAVPVFIAGQALRIKTKHAEEQRIKSARGREKGTDEVFVCERVCTSKRMLKKVGSFSKDPIPDTCVTVCGVSELDACADACARTVCVNQHPVPNWNDVCLRRCQNECLKLSVSRPS